MYLKFLDTENPRIKISLWELNPKVKKEVPSSYLRQNILSFRLYGQEYNLIASLAYQNNKFQSECCWLATEA